MDKIDIQLLRCLQKNSRAKASDISRQINLSVSAVIERIRKLEESGVIRQYTCWTTAKWATISLR